MRPLYLPAADSLLFAVLHEPPPGTARRGRILLAPPIGEELNRCRLALSTAARSWATRGWLTLIVDLYGTGDSPGDFGEATVERWQEDLRGAWRWLRAHEAPGDDEVLWAVRGGARLGLSLLAELDAGRLILWAPQFAGKEVVDSVLRLATASEMLAPRAGEPSARERISQRGASEIGGYRWSEALLSGFEQLDAQAGPRAANDRPLLWLEPQGRSDRTVSPPDPDWKPQPVHGAAFWRTAEPVTAEPWAAATADWLQREAA